MPRSIAMNASVSRPVQRVARTRESSRAQPSRFDEPRPRAAAHKSILNTSKSYNTQMMPIFEARVFFGTQGRPGDRFGQERSESFTNNLLQPATAMPTRRHQLLRSRGSGEDLDVAARRTATVLSEFSRPATDNALHPEDAVEYLRYPRHLPSDRGGWSTQRSGSPRCHGECDLKGGA